MLSIRKTANLTLVSIQTGILLKTNSQVEVQSVEQRSQQAERDTI